MGEDSQGGLERQSFRLPGPEHAAFVEREQAKDGEIRPYFLLQAPDYREIKGRFLDHIIAGKSGPPAGLTDLNSALEVLNLADWLKPLLFQVFDSGAPWRWNALTMGTRDKV